MFTSTTTQARSLLRRSLIAGPHLQEQDQERGRATPTRRGGMGQSWSAYDRHWHQDIVQETEACVAADGAL